jgi:phage gpG-like protein
MTKVTHNVDARAVSKIMKKEIVAMVNDVAEAFAGAEADGELVGVVSVLAAAGKSPPPSNPGDPPNWRTGTLARSWRTRKAKPSDKMVVAVAGTNVKYAEWLENGTKRNGKTFMAARPFMAKSVKSMEAYGKRRLKKAQTKIRREIQALGGPA